MELMIDINKRILVIAPHPDDESIGCGGMMSIYGRQCDVLLLTDGRKGYSPEDDVNEDELVLLRKKELESACSLAEVHQVFCLGIEDGEFKNNCDILSAFDISDYDYIFVPNRFERHDDHKYVLQTVKKMIRKQKANATVYEYEVWSPLSLPTHVLDISHVIEAKMKMVKVYQTQIKYVDYEGITESLAKYRGRSFNTDYAEVYSIVMKEDILHKIYRKLPGRFREMLKRCLSKF